MHSADSSLTADSEYFGSVRLLESYNLRHPQDMARVLSKAVMRWWPDEMVPYHRPRAAVEEARRLWEAAQLYEPFDVTGQVGAKYGEQHCRVRRHGRCGCFPHGCACNHCQYA